MDKNASIIWDLFYAFGTSKCAGANSKMIMVNWKECGRQRFWSMFLYYVENCLKGLRKSTDILFRTGCLLLAESNSLGLSNTIQDSLAQIRLPQAQRRRRTPWFSRVPKRMEY
jgi:hypothetical protein